MKRPCQSKPYRQSARLWRMILVGLGTLILCSCKGPFERGATPSWPGDDSPALPQEAYTGIPPQDSTAGPPVVVGGPPGMELGVPLPYAATGPWAPPGLPQPWPEDEYLADGGDGGLTASVGPDWEVRGLEPQDTIAHFDTLDGRRGVVPSNRVHIYSPRFGAVRQVVSLRQNEQHHRSAGIHLPTQLVRHDEVQTIDFHKQDLQTERQVSRDLPGAYRSRQGDARMSSAEVPTSYHNSFKPYEDFAAIRQGVFHEAEMAWLAERVNAAVAWTHHQAVQVILDEQAAAAEVGHEHLSTVYTVGVPPGEARLRIIKVASTPFAEPGDQIDFTLRFDNVGTQLIGNVTIIDSLTTRLEYVPQSAQCSLAADLSTQANEGDSLILRWEITDPLEPGKGGIIRFHCRVR